MSSFTVQVFLSAVPLFVIFTESWVQTAPLSFQVLSADTDTDNPPPALTFTVGPWLP